MQLNDETQQALFEWDTRRRFSRGPSPMNPEASPLRHSTDPLRTSFVDGSTTFGTNPMALPSIRRLSLTGAESTGIPVHGDNTSRLSSHASGAMTDRSSDATSSSNAPLSLEEKLLIAASVPQTSRRPGRHSRSQDDTLKEVLRYVNSKDRSRIQDERYQAKVMVLLEEHEKQSRFGKLILQRPVPHAKHISDLENWNAQNNNHTVGGGGGGTSRNSNNNNNNSQNNSATTTIIATEGTPLKKNVDSPFKLPSISISHNDGSVGSNGSSGSGSGMSGRRIGARQKYNNNNNNGELDMDFLEKQLEKQIEAHSKEVEERKHRPSETNSKTTSTTSTTTKTKTNHHHDLSPIQFALAAARELEEGENMQKGQQQHQQQHNHNHNNHHNKDYVEDNKHIAKAHKPDACKQQLKNQQSMRSIRLNAVRENVLRLRMEEEKRLLQYRERLARKDSVASRKVQGKQDMKNVGINIEEVWRNWFNVESEWAIIVILASSAMIFLGAIEQHRQERLLYIAKRIAARKIWRRYSRFKFMREIRRNKIRNKAFQVIKKFIHDYYWQLQMRKRIMRKRVSCLIIRGFLRSYQFSRFNSPIQVIRKKFGQIQAVFRSYIKRRKTHYLVLMKKWRQLEPVLLEAVLDQERAAMSFSCNVRPSSDPHLAQHQYMAQFHASNPAVAAFLDAHARLAQVKREIEQAYEEVSKEYLDQLRLLYQIPVDIRIQEINAHITAKLRKYQLSLRKYNKYIKEQRMRQLSLQESTHAQHSPLQLQLQQILQHQQAQQMNMQMLHRQAVLSVSSQQRNGSSSSSSVSNNNSNNNNKKLLDVVDHGNNNAIKPTSKPKHKRSYNQDKALISKRLQNIAKNSKQHTGSGNGNGNGNNHHHHNNNNNGGGDDDEDDDLGEGDDEDNANKEPEPPRFNVFVYDEEALTRLINDCIAKRKQTRKARKAQIIAHWQEDLHHVDAEFAKELAKAEALVAATKLKPFR